MTIRSILRLAAVLAALSPPAVAAQTVYEIPDDLSYLNLPGDPAEYVRLVAAGERNPDKMFHMGCPSDGGWVGAVFDGLEAAAETNTVARDKLYGALVLGERRCPADEARLRSFHIDSFRRDYEEGRNVLPKVAMGWSTDPEVHALVRRVARDMDVYPMGRYVAALVMIKHRMQDGTSLLEAQRAVVLDLASAPRIAYSRYMDDSIDWEGEMVELLVAEYGDAFRCEYERIVGEHRPPKPVKPRPERKRIGWALTKEEAERLGVTLPPGVDFHTPPPEPKPCPGTGAGR